MGISRRCLSAQTVDRRRAAYERHLNPGCLGCKRWREPSPALLVSMSEDKCLLCGNTAKRKRTSFSWIGTSIFFLLFSTPTNRAAFASPRWAFRLRDRARVTRILSGGLRLQSLPRRCSLSFSAPSSLRICRSSVYFRSFASRSTKSSKMPRFRFRMRSRSSSRVPRQQKR